MDDLVWFIVVSAAIYVLLEGVKQIPAIGGNKIFNDVLPVIPLALGVLVGMLVGPSIVEGMKLGPSAVAGLLAGGLSGSCYAVIKRVLEKKAEIQAGITDDP